jgi:hypothetical protein
MDEMPQHWVEREFIRTGLPKSAFAGYLGIDNAAVSRIVSGERPLGPEEAELARAFFSIVSERAPESLKDAIRRLRSTKIREASGVMLSSWLLERIGPKDSAGIDLLAPIAAQKATLRADQIVALCRMLEIDVTGLVQGFGVRSRLGESVAPRDLLAALNHEATRWVRDGSMPYRFDRRSDTTTPPCLAASKTSFVTLQPADPAGDELAACIPYLIPDDSYAPRFEQGQTIFLDARTEPRKGDYVAAVVKDSNSEEVKAVLGRLLYVSRDRIGISSARSIRLEVPRGDVTDLRRIAFCKL